MRTRVLVVALTLVFAASISKGQQLTNEDSPRLIAKFRQYSGIDLVFDREHLPAGTYHDVMTPLPTARRNSAIQIAIREAQKFPPQYLKAVGLEALGIFNACASRRGDGYRPFDEELNGYKYFGIYNGKHAVAAAYYSDEQLPLTFHHEIFHHIDRVTDVAETVDRRWEQVLSGENLYPAPSINGTDLAALKRASWGRLLTDAVSEYAKKNPGEDKAETARHLMSTLPDSLVQIVERPELPGSQRLLHVLDKYRRSLNGKGPQVNWFVDVALQRQSHQTDPATLVAFAKEAERLSRQLNAFATGTESSTDRQVRQLLQAAQQLAEKGLDSASSATLTNASAAVAQKLLVDQIRPSDQDRAFVVLGHEDADGVNWTLRKNVASYGEDASRLSAIAALSPQVAEQARRIQLQNLRLLARFYVFITKRWNVTAPTRQVFEDSRDRFARSLATFDPALSTMLLWRDLASLADAIQTDGSIRPVENAYIKNVDTEIEDASLRQSIYCVQPACVRIGGGSGVNVSPQGHILTAAHVALSRGREFTVEFPDRRKYIAVCTAINNDLDLAVCEIDSKERLPFARVASVPPRRGFQVVCIGQPGTHTPSGKPTDYQPFHVSTGEIRGFLGDPLGSQTLGRTKHDAWTYWGHSGSPLFNAHGEIVAMHNSWDPTTAMRHAVTQQAIAKFLSEQEIADGN